MAGMILCFT